VERGEKEGKWGGAVVFIRGIKMMMMMTSSSLLGKTSI